MITFVYSTKITDRNIAASASAAPDVRRKRAKPFRSRQSMPRLPTQPASASSSPSASSPSMIFSRTLEGKPVFRKSQPEQRTVLFTLNTIREVVSPLELTRSVISSVTSVSMPRAV